MSQAETTEVLRSFLNQQYGGKVGIEYIDIFDERLDDFEKIQKLVDEESTPLPIVTFGEEVVFAGYLSYPHLTQELTKRGIKP